MKWEYIGVNEYSRGELVSKLNALGQEGWELVTAGIAAVPDNKVYYAFLKRPQN